jgi:hypothetical protein
MASGISQNSYMVVSIIPSQIRSVVLPGIGLSMFFLMKIMQGWSLNGGATNQLLIGF